MDTIVLDCTKELHDFRMVVNDFRLPTIDIEAALDQIFEAVKFDHSTNIPLIQCAFDMSADEGLYENSKLHQDQQVKIYDAVMQIGEEIKNKLKYLNAYSDGYLHYNFRKLINDSTVILSRASESESPGPRDSWD